jgi:hypothetical protein
MSAGKPLKEIQEAFASQSLFEDKTWRLSPQAWPLTPAQLKEIEKIGQACLEFYKASERLYLSSVEGKNILRNRQLEVPWVADYMDRGKPAKLLDHARSKSQRRRIPSIIRPDLLLTDDGFTLTEMDSVPGGVGLTAYLNRLYEDGGSIIGADDRMIYAFYESLDALCPEIALPTMAIVVSDEASTYRPEMEWLAGQLQELGFKVYTLHPGDLFPMGDTICADIDGDPEEIHLIYRFWELFDYPNVEIADTLLEFAERGVGPVVAPPMRPFQEEKNNLALFHHHLLQDFWKESLSKSSYRVLKKIIPGSWIMDPVDLPPNAVLDAPFVGGKPIYSWEQLGEASQKERNLILKLSGFHENAWGARSVLLGSDASREEWVDGIQEALDGAKESLYLLQEYKKPARIKHPIYSPEGQVYEMQGRLRLCPYYFVEGDKAEVGGILATFCPADKKIIHGMRDAALLPCKLDVGEDGADTCNGF